MTLADELGPCCTSEKIESLASADPRVVRRGLRWTTVFESDKVV